MKGKRGARQREGMDPGAQEGEKILVSKRREAPKKKGDKFAQIFLSEITSPSLSIFPFLIGSRRIQIPPP